MIIFAMAFFYLLVAEATKFRQSIRMRRRKLPMKVFSKLLMKRTPPRKKAGIMHWQQTPGAGRIS